MPLGDITEQNAFLDNQFGTAHGSAAPTSHDLALYTASPDDGGVEITGPGYARVTIDNDSTWPDAADGMKSVTVTFPDPTDAWDEAWGWVLFNGSAITAWEQFDDPLDIAEAGDGPDVEVIVYIPSESNVSI